ncbi:MAG: aromatic ring-hydroxylating oxygenase subunit alpha, partial [Marivivens sp.]
MTITQSPLLDHCPPTLPAAAYYDADWFARERRGIWQREWVYAGRLNDLPKGKMRPLTVGGAGVILCRSPEGDVTAYHNTCRHRGSELCRAEQPLGKTIRCPYHAWSYAAADGRLLSTAHATPTEDFVKADNGLYPVAVTLWNGFVFLNIAESPAPFAPDLGLAAYDNWPMADLVTGHRVVR